MIEEVNHVECMVAPSAAASAATLGSGQPVHVTLFGANPSGSWTGQGTALVSPGTPGVPSVAGPQSRQTRWLAYALSFSYCLGKGDNPRNAASIASAVKPTRRPDRAGRTHLPAFRITDERLRRQGRAVPDPKVEGAPFQVSSGQSFLSGPI